MPILCDFSDCRARFPSYLILHSRSPRFHNQENRRNTRDRTSTVSPVEETNFANVANFNPCSIIDITLRDTSGGSPWSPRLATDPFFSLRRREFPFLVDRSRRSPRTRRDTLAPVRLARSRSHGCTTQQASSLPFVQCTPLFLPPCTPGFGRDVAWSARFRSETTRAEPPEGLERLPISHQSILSTIPERCIRRCMKRDFPLARFEPKFEAKFSTTGIFSTFSGKQIVIFFSHRFVLIIKCAITRAAITSEKWWIFC